MKKILIISGGISKERIISLDTGKQVAKTLIRNGYKVKISEPGSKILEIIKSFKPNIIFNALHGQFGDRVMDTPITESAFIGAAAGAAIAS